MDIVQQFPKIRLRRLRNQAKLRNFVREISLRPKDLVLPLFIKQGIKSKQPIISLSGHYQISLADLECELEQLLKLGVQNLILFGIPDTKDEVGRASYADDGIIQTAVRKIKELAPDLLIIVDACLCEYTTSGHCGVLSTNVNQYSSVVDNDKTLIVLGQQAVTYAQAGADIIAPSGMMDGMVGALRHALDHAGFASQTILSYAVKYASAMYGPFRDAAEGVPQFGDRCTHQMDYANRNEALRECALDITEGADMLMVKPAHTYLDIIMRIKHAYPALPLGAYHTSGEFALLKAAAAQGWVEEKAAVLEVLTAIKRAGADFIVTYYAREVLAWMHE